MLGRVIKRTLSMRGGRGSHPLPIAESPEEEEERGEEDEEGEEEEGEEVDELPPRRMLVMQRSLSCDEGSRMRERAREGAMLRVPLHTTPPPTTAPPPPPSPPTPASSAEGEEPWGERVASHLPAALLLCSALAGPMMGLRNLWGEVLLLAGVLAWLLQRLPMPRDPSVLIVAASLGGSVVAVLLACSRAYKIVPREEVKEGAAVADIRTTILAVLLPAVALVVALRHPGLRQMLDG